MTNGSIARPNRPMSPRKAKIEAERKRFLINELSRMGSHGWQHYTFRDWQPLETELRQISRCK